MPKKAKKVAKAPRVGQRRIKNGKEQIYMIQGGRGFWGDAWKFVKKAAGGVHDVVKKSGIIGNTLSTIPGFAGKLGGFAAKQAGYGQRGAGGRFVKQGNAYLAM